MTPKQFMETSLSRDLPDKNYSPVAARLATNLDLLRLVHAGIGMSGETGEILDTLKKSLMYGKALDLQNLKEECGDVLWYMAVMLDQLGSSFEEVMQMNVDKLAKRYPNGFSEKDAIARADKADR
jgi:NTP pyrophosphatase (non-canonical NTP hydrolase)